MATHLIGTFDIVGMFRDLYKIQPAREVEAWLHAHGICNWQNCDVGEL